MHVQPVERPAQPRGDARAPLLARELAQMRRVTACAGAGSRRFVCVHDAHALGRENDGGFTADTSQKERMYKG